MADADHKVGEELEIKEIPGSYGWPVLGAIKDRLDFFWFQGEKEFWASRMKKYKSTVFKVNVAPSPPGFPSNPVVMLLDQKSYPILFDTSKVEKKDMLLANYMPRTSFYGGIRPCVYLDPSEERHTKIKSFIMDLMKQNANKWIPEMQKAVLEVCPKWEEEMKKKGRAEVNGKTSQVACNVLLRTLVGRDPGEPGEASLGTHGPLLFLTWLGPQLVPIARAGLPHLLEELLLHTCRIPYFLVSPAYHRLVRFIEAHGGHLLDTAVEGYGLDRQDALHNIVFFLGFNAFGGLYLFFPQMLGYVGRAGLELQEALAAEVRAAVDAEGGELNMAAISRMELGRSVVYESLRMSPPVPYQYARAKEDLVVESHSGRYRIPKGQILGGCQAVAARDPQVFDRADAFVPDRFVGPQGRQLLQYVLWSNGPSTSPPSLSNKQCPAADLVPFLSQTLLACMFLRYHSYTTYNPTPPGDRTPRHFSSLRGKSSTHHFSSLNKAPDI